MAPTFPHRHKARDTHMFIYNIDGSHLTVISEANAFGFEGAGGGGQAAELAGVHAAEGTGAGELAAAARASTARRQRAGAN